MPDRIGAFLRADRCLTRLGVNITRVSYNKALDAHMLFIEVDGTEDQLREAESELTRLGYLADASTLGGVILIEFRLRDEPGALLPVLELIDDYNLNISYISSQENGTHHQYFKMGLYVENGREISDFMKRASLLCRLRVVEYKGSEKILDNTVFYLSFVNDIAERNALSEADQTELMINANLVMQNLDERNSHPYKTFEYIGRFADALQKYKGSAFQPRLSIHKTCEGLLFYLIEPPCGSNICILCCGGRYLFVDSGFACYREEQLSTIRDILPGFDALPRDAMITHADVDHCGMLDLFETVYLSQKCFDNFRKEQDGEANIREEHPLHLPYVKISKILSAYQAPALDNLRVVGGTSDPQQELLVRIGTLEYAPLCFEVYEGAGGHVAGETVYLDRKHRLVFTGDIFVNLKEFSAEQADFNRLAPYLMTSVDSKPPIAGKVRHAVFDLLDPGNWLIVGGHGAVLRYTK